MKQDVHGSGNSVKVLQGGGKQHERTEKKVSTRRNSDARQERKNQVACQQRFHSLETPGPDVTIWH